MIRHFARAALAVALLVSGSAHAVAPINYVLQTPQPETYAPLTGGTPVGFSSSADDDIVSLNLPSGYDFRWFGVPVTSMQVATNGFISFSTTNLTLCDSGCTAGNGIPVLAQTFGNRPVDAVYLWWRDLVIDSSTRVTSGFEVINGISVFTIDFNSIRYYGSSANVTLSMKARLYPGGSRIEVVYGTITGTSTGSSSGATVGLQNSAYGPTALSVAGLPCTTPTALCGTAEWQANKRFTYAYADKPDLQVASSQISSVTTGPNVGDAVNVSLSGVIRNDGTLTTGLCADADGGKFDCTDAGLPSPTFDATLYFSSTPRVDPLRDTPIARTTLSALASGADAVASLSGTFTRPAVGKYYLVMVADPIDATNPLGAVDEVSEDNNQRAATVYMGTDLTGTISAPDGGDVDTQVPVRVSIVNQGIDIPAQPVAWKVFLSADNTVSSDDVEVQSGTLQPNEIPFNQTLQILLPQNAPASDIHFLLQVDVGNATVEADETNNTLSTENTTHVRLPDMSVTSVELRNPIAPNPAITQAFFGTTALMRVVVQNNGEAAARNFDVSFYLSGGLGAAVITVRDQAIDRDIVAELLPGASRTLERVVTIPADSNALDARGNPIPWAVGDFFFGAIADSDGALGEVNKGNNVGKVGPINVRQTAPDFSPIRLDVPNAAAIGESLPVFRVIRNLGNRLGTSQAVGYRYYLSANALITHEDVPLKILRPSGAIDEGTVSLEVGADDRGSDLVLLPPDVSPGTYHVGIVVNPARTVEEIDYANNALDASSTVVVAIGSLVITTPRTPDGIVGVPYAFQFASVGAATTTWALADGSVLPAGLTLSVEGRLTGTPTEVGAKAFTVTVSGGGQAASVRVALRVNEIAGPLQLLTRNLPSALGGQSYSQKLIAVGGQRPYTWRRLAGTLPSGLTLAADGTLAGTPAQPASSAPAMVTFEVKDALGATATETVGVRVIGANALRLVTETLPAGFVGQTYPPAGTDNSLSATKGTAPYTFSVLSGELPAGLRLIADVDRAKLSGKPTTPGVYPFTVRVVDSSGQIDDRDYAIVIQAGVLSLVPIALPTVLQGQPYDADLSGIVARAKWTIYSGALPPGITLDGAGFLGGTCAKDATPGTYSFIAQAVDRNGASGLIAESIIVLAPEKKIPTDEGGCSSTGGNGLWAMFGVMGLALSRRRRMGALAAVAAVVAPISARAAYTPATTPNISYSAIAGGTGLSGSAATAATVTLPFAFRFFGTTYNSVSVGSSGYLAFTGSASSARPNLGAAPAIAAWWDGLQATQSGSSLTWQVVGTAPAREVVFQWTRADNSQDVDSFFSSVRTSFNFRVRLHEYGQIDLEYGSLAAAGSFSSAAIGISDGRATTLFPIACANSAGGCTGRDFPSNTRVTFTSGADLVVGALTTAGVASQGATTPLVATISNQGGDPVTGAQLEFVASRNAVLGDADDEVLGNVAVAPLGANETRQVTQGFDTTGRAVGTYQMFARIDPGNTVVEESESNNIGGPTRLDVVAPLPDLSVSQVTGAQHAAKPGDAFQVTFQVQNTTNVAVPTVAYAIYLSTNGVVSQSDVKVGQGTVTAIAPNGTASGSGTATVPATLLSGRYTLGVVLDPDQQLTEASKLNNVAADPTLVAISTDVLSVVGPVSGALASTSLGATYGYAFGASGGDGQYVFSSSSTLPPGLTLSAQGILQGRPSAASATPYSMEIAVADGAGRRAQATFTLVVADASLPFRILSRDLVVATYDQPYSFALAATGGKPPYAWSLTGEGRLPLGLQLGADGTIEGAAGEAGTFNFTAQVADSTAGSTPLKQAYTLVVAAPERMRVASPQLPEAQLGKAYRALLGVAGGAGGYSWAFPFCADAANCRPVRRLAALPTDPEPTNYEMPRGLYFACDDQLNAIITSDPPKTGPCARTLPAEDARVPREAGTFAIDALITDRSGTKLQVTFVVKVGFGQGITITTNALPDALIGRDYDFKLQAVSPESKGALTWSLACTERDAAGLPLDPCPAGLPGGLTLDADGRLHGKTSDAKTTSFLVRASDDEGRAALRALAVTSHNPAPAASTDGCGVLPGEGPSALALLSVLGSGTLLRRRRARPSR